MSGALRMKSSDILHALRRRTITHFHNDPIPRTTHYVGNRSPTRPFFSKIANFPARFSSSAVKNPKAEKLRYLVIGGALRMKSSDILLPLRRRTITHFHNDPIPLTTHYVGKRSPTRPFFSKFPNFPARFSSSAAKNPKSGFVDWYLGMVKARPVLTKSVTCGVIYIAADLSSQTIARLVSEEASYDPWRTSRMAGYAIIILGPSLHFWYTFLSRRFPKRDIPSTLKKMFMGQAIYGPIMTVAFFCVNASLQGEDSNEVVARLKRDLAPTLITGVMYWPFCDFITFKFIPVHLQPLMSNSFSYLWTIYLTYMAGLEKVDTTTASK